MENKMAIIALENIRKSYADGSQMHHVLNQLNLSVEPNEFVAILGPSGSGKSTLLAIALAYSYQRMRGGFLSLAKI